jgi:hypothetical protein
MPKAFSIAPGFVDLSAFDHGRDLADVANVLGWVAIDQDHVGQFSRAEGAMGLCSDPSRRLALMAPCAEQDIGGPAFVKSSIFAKATT